MSSFNLATRTPRIYFTICLSLVCFFAVILSGPLTSRFARAATNTIVVNTTSDASVCSQDVISLRCAIATANANVASSTQITFNLSGTILVASPLLLDNASQPITIDGSGQSVVLDGGSATQILNINAGNVTLNNLTISHGSTSADYTGSYADGNGGGIYLNAGTLTIDHSTLSLNYAFDPIGGNGGAVYVKAGTLTINNSILSHDSAINVGGGVYNDTGLVSISGTNFSNNAAQSGGSIFNANNGVTIDTSTFSANSAESGGAIYNGYGHSQMTITSSTFSNNTSQIKGGGAIYNNSALLMSNSTLTGNTGDNGGAVYAFSGTLTLENNTLSGNQALYYGGGIYSKSAVVNLISTIVAGNRSPNGVDVNGSFVSFGHNLIGDGTTSSGLVNGNNGDQVGSSALRINPGLAALADNGGSTQTMALFPGSPAFGTGNCAGDVSINPPVPPVTTDQRGVTRGNPCDVGAYEGILSPTASSTSTPTSTNTPTSTAIATNSAQTATAVSLTETANQELKATATPTATDIGQTTTALAFTETAVQLTLTGYKTSTPQPRIDTIGVDRNGTFLLRLHNSTGNAEITFNFLTGIRPFPVVGSWFGSGIDQPGSYDQTNGQFTLCTIADVYACQFPQLQWTFELGIANDVPLSGHWSLSSSGDGVGVFRPSNGLIFLKNGLNTGYGDYTMVLGIPGDQGLAGDWSGNGFDSPGVYRPANSAFYLSNQVINGSVYGDYQFTYGVGGDLPVVGDWIAQGHDGIGLFRQSNGITYLKDQLTTGYADNTFVYGIAGDVPIAGRWQSIYPPIAPPSVLITRTASPLPSNNSIPGNNSLGD